MGYNDPHLEAKMNLETRYPEGRREELLTGRDAPRKFSRWIIAVFGAIVFIILVAWIASAIFH